VLDAEQPPEVLAEHVRAALEPLLL
jgi:hypothetical protein